MKITDKRTAKVRFENGTSGSVSFFIIPLTALVDLNGSIVLAVDRTKEIVVPPAHITVAEIPTGYRIGTRQSMENTFYCRKWGATSDMENTSIEDYTDPGEIFYDMTGDCVRQGDIISATLSEPA